MGAERDDLVIGLIQRGADEIVHGRVDDDELFRFGRFAIEHAAEERASGADDGAAGFHHELQVVAGAAGADVLDVGGDVGFDLIRLVGDAEAATEVKMPDGHAAGAEAADEGEHGIERFFERGGVEQLRTDVAADAFGDDVFELQGARVDVFGGGDIDAELVIAKAGGDIGVGLGVDVGVDADGDTGLDAETGGDGIDEREFRFRFAVEAVDAARESVFDLFAGFADAGEDHLFRAAAGAEDAVEFAAGDDVEAGAFGGEEAEDAQV